MTQKKFSYGWVIVAYGVLVMCTLHYLCFNSFAIFMVPITEDLQISRATLSLVTTISSLVGMVMAPIAGRILSRRSVKKLMFAGILVAGLSIAAQSRVTSVVQLYALAAVRDTASEFCLAMPFSMLMTRWFDKQRSFATSLIFVGISLGGTFFSNPLTALIAARGWRFSYAVCGLFVALLVAPICLFVIRDHPEGAQEEAPEPQAGPEEGPSESIYKNPNFWLYIVGMCANAFSFGIMYHMSAFIQSAGYAAAVAASMISLYNMVCIFGKMGVGWIFDRLGLRPGILFVTVGTISSFVLMLVLLGTPSMAVLVLAAAAFGIGNVSQSMFSPALISNIFGVKRYSEVYGISASFTMLVSAFSNPVISGLYDATGSYRLSWTLCLCTAAAGAVCLLWVSRRAQKQA